MDHDKPKLRCSVGVTAYNEEANIGRLLEALLTQHLRDVEISEIIVVASACTDNTVPIVESYAAEYPLVKLFTQPRREGKTSAINVFLANASEDICVLESGDTLPARGRGRAPGAHVRRSHRGHDRRAQDPGQHARSPGRVSSRTCGCAWSTSSAWRSRAWAR